MAFRELHELDPGIHDAVWRLREAGFETTDSGDGVSKPADWYESGEALPYPHVVAELRKDIVMKRMIEMECLRMRDYLGPGWVVQAMYTTDSKSWTLFASLEVPK